MSLPTSNPGGQNQNLDIDASFWRESLQGAAPVRFASNSRHGVPLPSPATYTALSSTSTRGTLSHNDAIKPSTKFFFAVAYGLRLLTDQVDVAFAFTLDSLNLDSDCARNGVSLCRVVAPGTSSVWSVLETLQNNLRMVGAQGAFDFESSKGFSVDATAIANTVVSFGKKSSESKSAILEGEEASVTPLTIEGMLGANGQLSVTVTSQTYSLPLPDAEWLAKHICTVFDVTKTAFGGMTLDEIPMLDPAQMEKIFYFSVNQKNVSVNGHALGKCLMFSYHSE
jgi:hypothetical protein